MTQTASLLEGVTPIGPHAIPLGPAGMEISLGDESPCPISPSLLDVSSVNQTLPLLSTETPCGTALAVGISYSENEEVEGSKEPI